MNDRQKAALLAFLRRPLTDPRVRDESGPFERPALSTETNGRLRAARIAAGVLDLSADQPQHPLTSAALLTPIRKHGLHVWRTAAEDALAGDEIPVGFVTPDRAEFLGRTMLANFRALEQRERLLIGIGL